jgi:hypothetical protein
MTGYGGRRLALHPASTKRPFYAYYPLALRISKRLYVMGHGRIVVEGSADDLKANEGVRKEWLEV